MGKGQFVSKEVIVATMELSPDISGDKYSFARLAFISFLKLQTLRDTGKEVVVKCEKDGVRILTDSESIDYLNEQFILGLRKAVRAHISQQRIDLANLSEDEKRRNRTFINNQSMIVQAIKREAKKTRTLGIHNQYPEAVI
jgi:hypothetical protein